MFFKEEIKNIKSGKKELHQFGITMGIVLALVGGLLIWRSKDYYFFFFVFSIAFLFLGLVIPALLKPIQKVWMSIAVIIGWVMTRVILTVLFYLVVTPVGILAKVFGKDFLDTKFDRNANSYWSTRESEKFDKRNYESQF
jgi:hypothetical protein